MRNWVVKDHCHDSMIEAIEQGVIEHRTYFARKHPKMEVVVEDDVVVVNTHTDSSGFNCIYTTRFVPEDVECRVLNTVNYFKKNNRPFSWLIGPTTPEKAIFKALNNCGLKKIYQKHCMLLDTRLFKKRLRYIRGFKVLQGLTPTALKDFQKILQSSTDEFTSSKEYFSQITSLPIHTSDPVKLFVGYLDNRPAAVGELYFGSGIAVMITFVHPDFKRKERDLVVDMSTKMVLLAKCHGYHHVIAKSNQEYCYYYSQMGFKKYCLFCCYQ